MPVITLANIALATSIAAELARLVSGSAEQISAAFYEGEPTDFGAVADDIAELTGASADAAGAFAHLNALLKKAHKEGRDVTDAEIGYFRARREQIRARWTSVADRARQRIAQAGGAGAEGGGSGTPAPDHPEAGLPGSGSAHAESGQAPTPEEAPPPAA